MSVLAEYQKLKMAENMCCRKYGNGLCSKNNLLPGPVSSSVPLIVSWNYGSRV